MNHIQIRKFLKALGSDPGETYEHEQWIVASCPLAPWTHDSGTDANPSFAINCKPNGESHFHCFTCRSGDLLRLLELLRSYGAKKPKYNIKAAMEVLAEEEESDVTLDIKDFDEPPLDLIKTVPWPEDWLDTFWKAINVPVAMEYLNGRNVDKETAVALDIRWDGQKSAVCFPVRDWDGRLVGLRGRRIEGGYHDYGGPLNHRNKLVWFGESTVDLEAPVLMVESVFDVSSAWRVYKNIVAPFSVGMSPAKMTRMYGALDIVTLFDNGKGGDKARDLIESYFDSAVKVHCKPPEHRDDPGEMTVEELCNVLEDKLKLTIDTAG